MNATRLPAEARAIRNAALLQAEVVRSRSTEDALVEYSETVTKLRERFEADVYEASLRLRYAVRPAHQAYNAAVIEAERASVA